MSRPIDADGTIRYSTGRPGFEKAFAVAAPPKSPTKVGSRTAMKAVMNNRRTNISSSSIGARRRPLVHLVPDHLRMGCSHPPASPRVVAQAGGPPQNGSIVCWEIHVELLRRE